MTMYERISQFLDDDDAYNSYENIDISYCTKNILEIIRSELIDIETEIILFENTKIRPKNELTELFTFSELVDYRRGIMKMIKKRFENK